MDNYFKEQKEKLEQLESLLQDVLNRLDVIEGKKDEKTILKPKDVAKLVGCSYHEALGYFKENDFPKITKGTGNKVTKKDLIKWLKERNDKNG